MSTNATMAPLLGPDTRFFRAQRPTGASVFGMLPWARLAEALQLTPRELQIVRNLFDSRTESEIAATLGIATRTVHTHLERIHRKLSVQSRAQLLTRVIGEYLSLMPRLKVEDPIPLPDSGHHCPFHPTRSCPFKTGNG